MIVDADICLPFSSVALFMLDTVLLIEDIVHVRLDGSSSKAEVGSVADSDGGADGGVILPEEVPGLEALALGGGCGRPLAGGGSLGGPKLGVVAVE